MHLALHVNKSSKTVNILALDALTVRSATRRQVFKKSQHVQNITLAPRSGVSGMVFPRPMIFAPVKQLREWRDRDLDWRTHRL
jgi:hypothetical protein